MNQKYIADDVASQMLNALIIESPEEGYPEAIVSVDEMIHYMKKYINSLPIPARKNVGMILVSEGRKDALNACPEGTAIHLDPLSEEIIRKMYNMMICLRR